MPQVDGGKQTNKKPISHLNWEKNLHIHTHRNKLAHASSNLASRLPPTATLFGLSRADFDKIQMSCIHKSSARKVRDKETFNQVVPSIQVTTYVHMYLAKGQAP